MELNWVTVAAQIVNFLILVWLLHRFLYGPVTRAMERRQNHIRERVQEAEAMRAKAEEERNSLKAEREKLSQSREDMLTEARNEADTLRRKLEKQAREKVDADQQAWFAHLAGDRDEVLNDIRRRAREEFFAIARTIFEDLADERLEARMAVAFARKLKALPEETKDKLKEAIGQDASAAQIESAFLIAQDSREIIEPVLKEILHADHTAEYVQKKDVIAGIRLRVGSQVVEWSIDSYLDELEERLGMALSMAGVPETAKAAS